MMSSAQTHSNQILHALSQVIQDKSRILPRIGPAQLYSNHLRRIRTKLIALRKAFPFLLAKVHRVC